MEGAKDELKPELTSQAKSAAIRSCDHITFHHMIVTGAHHSLHGLGRKELSMNALYVSYLPIETKISTVMNACVRINLLKHFAVLHLLPPHGVAVGNCGGPP